jgi:hypothetical protein
MGWYMTDQQDLKKFVAELIKPQRGYSYCYKTIAHSLVGNVLFSVWEFETETGVSRIIRVSLLRKKRGGGWGHKPMSEDMGPFYYTCPLKFLKTVPVANKSWREGVVAYHEAKRMRDAVKKRVAAKGKD